MLGSCWSGFVCCGSRFHDRRKELQMDRDPQVLDTLAAAFRLLVTGPAPLAVDGKEIHPSLPPRAIPLDELRDLLLDGHTSNSIRDAALAELIRRAKEERGAWVIGLAGVLLPGLRRVAGRLARDFPGESADIDAEVLAGFLEALNRLEPSGEHLASRSEEHKSELQSRGHLVCRLLLEKKKT